MPSDPRVLGEQLFFLPRDLCVFVVNLSSFCVFCASSRLFPSPISYPIHRDRLSADRPES
jgi:hypothetical protein